MIQNIFLPTKINNYYLFSQRIIGFDITKTHVHATLVLAKGSTITIARQESVPLPNDGAQYHEKLISTLPDVLKKMGKFDQIITALASSLVVFKELRLPFTTRDKISMIIAFEVQPLLPFPAQEAVLDFIITKINSEDNSAQVLVAAAQKKHIAEHLSVFEQAGITPSKITVDMFALYGLYSEIPAYKNLHGLVVLIDLNMYHTSIIAILETQIRIIRTLSYGLATVAKDAGSSTDLKPQKVMDHLIRFGSNDSKTDNDQVIKNSLSSFFNKLQFALSSTINQLQNKTIEKVIFTGPGAEIKDLTSFAQQQLSSPCELFNYMELTTNKKYRISSTVTLSQPVLLSTAIAIPTPAEEEFNLRTGEFKAPTNNLLLAQLITGSIILILVLGGLITNTIIQSRRISGTMESAQQEAIDALKHNIKALSNSDEDDLEELLKSAKSELTKEEAIWRQFSPSERTSFLEYLLELTTHINKQQLGFEPEKITILSGRQDEILLKAKVSDHETLKQLERDLKKSKLFKYEESQPDPDFEMRIMTRRRA